MIEIKNLTRKFGDKTAVREVCLTFEKGGFIGIIGRSGAGKSTLLRMINRLLTPTSGSITCEGVDVLALKGKGLRDWRARCAMIFQQFNLAPRLDVFTNVMMGRINHMPGWRALLKLWPKKDRALVLSALETFEIAELAADRAEVLSGGQQQRVAICRALVQEPKVILADEPIASLDPHNAKLVMDMLARINKEFGITIVCNLHALDVAKAYCDRVIGLSSGEVVFDGAPSALDADTVVGLYGTQAKEVADLSGAGNGLRASAPTQVSTAPFSEALR